MRSSIFSGLESDVMCRAVPTVGFYIIPDVHVPVCFGLSEPLGVGLGDGSLNGLLVLIVYPFNWFNQCGFD